MVLLSPREHFICHVLLFKIYKNHEMAHALYKMSLCGKNQQRYTNSKLYDAFKPQIAILKSERMKGNTYNPGFPGEQNHFFGKHHSLETKQILSDKAKERFETFGHPRLGKFHSNSTKSKISKSKIGQGLNVPKSDQHKLKISAALSGKTKTEEHRKNISLARKGKIRQKTPCKHCGKLLDPGNLSKHYKANKCQQIT